ncbi:peptidylprolyl isomerase [Tissierella pigra]|uniref:peptidylprolyl isomerase n=1 Tax=Tissierella pigra TaxID=2607614 RepID=A0A6N7XWE5_9FIRM|nr:peptidylprolyl isomerase [Tissierella pigra]MBU5426074.1 peptidylprolyl isomerase [Tissierella pigra]MSU00805.1 peptidylprolyl isomerase [Tissierella pigra]
MKKSIVILTVVIALIISGCKNTDNQEETYMDIKEPEVVNYQSIQCRQIEEALKEEITATIETNYGSVVVSLFPKEAPLMVDNFIKLVEEKYYEDFGLVNVTSVSIGVGKIGEPDYTFKTATGENIPVEINEDFGMIYGSLVAPRRINVEGEESLNTGNFAIIDKDFLTDEEEKELIDMEMTQELREAFQTVGGNIRNHKDITVFGQVIKGMEVIEEIRKLEVGPLNQPNKLIQILSIKISE